MADIIIRQIDHATVRLEFSNEGIGRELSERFTFDVPNAKWSPKYKKRHWDGKIRLLNLRSSTISAGLVHSIIEFALENNYTVDDQSDIGTTVEFSLEEAKEFIKTLKLPTKYEVRDYQLRAFALAVRHKRCVLISPTQSGKSLVAYLIFRYYNKKTLIVVPTTTLVMQLQKDFEEYGYTKPIHQIMSGYEKISSEKVTISTWQSIFEQDAEFFEKYEVLIGDEAHLYKAKSLTAIMNNMPGTKYRIGMTGTLDGAEVHELVLRGLFGPIEQVATSAELMKKKNLAQLNVKILVLKHPKENRAKILAGTYQEELEYLFAYEPRNRFIRNLTVSLPGNTLVLYSYVEKHGEILYKMIKEKHENTHFVAGKVDTEDREIIRNLLKTHNDVKVIASYGTFQTGINMPRLNNTIFASSTKSRIRTLQSIGRGLALSEGKTTSTLYDIADDLSNGAKRNHTLSHMIERVKMYSSEKFPYEFHTIEIGKSPTVI